MLIISLFLNISCFIYSISASKFTSSSCGKHQCLSWSLLRLNCLHFTHLKNHVNSAVRIYFHSHQPDQINASHCYLRTCVPATASMPVLRKSQPVIVILHPPMNIAGSTTFSWFLFWNPTCHRTLCNTRTAESTDSLVFLPLAESFEVFPLAYSALLSQCLCELCLSFLWLIPV